MKGTATIAMAIAALLAAPSIALAHLVTSGLGPFYDGALHLLLSPGDLLGLLAAAMLAGLCGAKAGRLTVTALPVAWFMAGLVGLNLPVTLQLPWLSVVSFVILGVTVALDPKLPPLAVALLATLFGMLHGLLNGSALAVVGAGPIALFGIVSMVSIAGLLVSAFVVSLRPAWTRVAVRVAGSWVAAVGMLMFGWLVRGGR